MPISLNELERLDFLSLPIWHFGDRSAFASGVAAIVDHRGDRNARRTAAVIGGRAIGRSIARMVRCRQIASPEQVRHFEQPRRGGFVCRADQRRD